MPSLLDASLRLFVAYSLAGLLAAAGAFVLFTVGGPLGLLALFALVGVVFLVLGAGLVLR